MSDIVNSINQALQSYQETEESSFYKDYQIFSKQYDSLIKEGVTQLRESQLKTIQDQENVSPFAYNNR